MTASVTFAGFERLGPVRAGFWLLAGLALLGLSGCDTPTTLIERAVEDRSSSDIVKDNRIVVEINGIMADVGTIQASTEIYEQRLLITGLFDDPAKYQAFKRQVEAVEGVRQLYWHVRYMSEAQQKQAGDRLMSWDETLALDTKVGAALIAELGVSHVNYRVAVDSDGAVYVLGRAHSRAEERRALSEARSISGVRRVVDYVDVRP